MTDEPGREQTAEDVLHVGLSFFVLPGLVAPEAVLAALPWPGAVASATAPLSEAIMHTLHDGDTTDRNRERFAIVDRRGRTLVAPPGWYAFTGARAFEDALVAAFPDLEYVSSFDACPAIRSWQDGELVLDLHWGEMKTMDAIARLLDLLGARRFEELFPRLSDDTCTLCRIEV